MLSLQDVVKGLFVCCLFLDFVSLSRRLIPELMNFLLGVLYIAAPNKQGYGEPPVHFLGKHLGMFKSHSFIFVVENLKRKNQVLNPWVVFSLGDAGGLLGF